jgi:hypothetical protein
VFLELVIEHHDGVVGHRTANQCVHRATLEWKERHELYHRAGGGFSHREPMIFVPWQRLCPYQACGLDRMSSCTITQLVIYPDVVA